MQDLITRAYELAEQYGEYEENRDDWRTRYQITKELSILLVLDYNIEIIVVYQDEPVLYAMNAFDDEADAFTLRRYAPGEWEQILEAHP